MGDTVESSHLCAHLIYSGPLFFLGGGGGVIYSLYHIKGPGCISPIIANGTSAGENNLIGMETLHKAKQQSIITTVYC